MFLSCFTQQTYFKSIDVCWSKHLYTITNTRTIKESYLWGWGFVYFKRMFLHTYLTNSHHFSLSFKTKKIKNYILFLYCSHCLELSDVTLIVIHQSFKHSFFFFICIVFTLRKILISISSAPFPSFLPPKKYDSLFYINLLLN